jgi:hypothetical protein
MTTTERRRNLLERADSEVYGGNGTTPTVQALADEVRLLELNVTEYRRQRDDLTAGLIDVAAQRDRLAAGLDRTASQRTDWAILAGTLSHRLTELQAAVDRLAALPTPFGAYLRWGETGDIESDNALEEWDDARTRLAGALAATRAPLPTAGTPAAVPAADPGTDHPPVTDHTGMHHAACGCREASVPGLDPNLDATNEACPDDPDGLHHVGCGCEDADL